MHIPNRRKLAVAVTILIGATPMVHVGYAPADCTEAAYGWTVTIGGPSGEEPYGVALSQNGDFVLVCETARYRITRYWLSGLSAGTSDVFVDNLPGFPDGASSNRKGIFWVGLLGVRNALVDWPQWRPLLKMLLSFLPNDF